MKKVKEVKMNEAIDIGEHGGEIEMLKDYKTVQKNGVKGGQGNTKTKKKKCKGYLEGKSMDKEAVMEGENFAGSRKVVEGEDHVKVLKKKKNMEGKKERNYEEVGHFKVSKEDNTNGGSSCHLMEHGVEDVCQATDSKIDIVKNAGIGHESDGGLVDKEKRKKKKKKDKDKKRAGIGYQFPEQSVEDVSLLGGHRMQNGEIVETGDVLDDCLVEKVGKKKRKREKNKNEVGASQDVTDLPSNATQELENTSTKGFEMDGENCKNVTKKSRKKYKTEETGKELNASGFSQETANSAGNEKGNVKVSKKDVKRLKKHTADSTNGASGCNLTEHCVEDVCQATDSKIDIVKTVETGQEFDGGLVDKEKRKTKKKEKGKKRAGIGYQFPEQSIEDVSLLGGHRMQNGKIVETKDVLDDCLVEKVGKKKRKKEKNKNGVEVNLGASQDVTDLPSNATQELENTSTKGFETDGESGKDVTKKSRKKHKTEETGKELNASGFSQATANSAGNEKGNVQKRKKINSVAQDDQNANAEKQKKKVKFSDQVEVFPLSDNEEKLVRGKRFSPEEDEIVKKAVNDYIEAHCLGDEGLKMVLNCRSHREVRNCWKEIASAIPYRPRDAVYHRAQNLFRRSESTKWSEEEYEMVKEFQKKHGNQWKLLAEDLQKHRVHVKDAWRRLRIKPKKGHWNQEEYQALFDLVNLDLKLRYKEEKKSKHGMLRDNICWTAISDKITTRSDATCCQKWYDQLTSSLVVEGEWADADDYRLIDSLYALDASCAEDVDWNNLLEHRSGDVCRKRWDQMVMHIGFHKTQSFGEQVEVLAKRYCPELIEVREEWDNKPYVD